MSYQQLACLMQCWKMMCVAVCCCVIRMPCEANATDSLHRLGNTVRCDCVTHTNAGQHAKCQKKGCHMHKGLAHGMGQSTLLHTVVVSQSDDTYMHNSGCTGSV